MTDGFDFYVEDDRIRVRFVTQRQLKRLRSGHNIAGDYSDRTIRVFRGEYRRSQRSVLMHELGHYLVARQELRATDTTEEAVCDLLTWLPNILTDERNGELLAFLGLEATT